MGAVIEITPYACYAIPDLRVVCAVRPWHSCCGSFGSSPGGSNVECAGGYQCVGEAADECGCSEAKEKGEEWAECLKDEENDPCSDEQQEAQQEVDSFLQCMGISTDATTTALPAYAAVNGDETANDHHMSYTNLNQHDQASADLILALSVSLAAIVGLFIVFCLAFYWFYARKYKPLKRNVIQFVDEPDHENESKNDHVHETLKE